MEFVGLSGNESYSMEDLSFVSGTGDEYPDLSWVENCSASQYMLAKEDLISCSPQSKSFLGQVRVFVREATHLWEEKGVLPLFDDSYSLWCSN
jgi:hypothetical protein